MTYQYQASLLTAGRAAKADLSMRPGFMQAAREFAPVLLFSALGLLTALYLIGWEVSGMVEKAAPRAAAANVLPELVISPQSLEPNLNGMLATGDGGASIPLEELVAGVSREAFHNHHAKTPASPTRTR